MRTYQVSMTFRTLEGWAGARVSIESAPDAELAFDAAVEKLEQGYDITPRAAVCFDPHTGRDIPQLSIYWEPQTA